ncbi:MAG: aspartate aminotransferase family protein [Ruminococcaceae bacterium]|nr:aspartate aminotransferase family protein [Oscillospiraceae bacterium]
MTFEELKKLNSEHILGTYARNDVAIIEGNGATVKDISGKEYIDFTSGIGVCSLGYGNKNIANAIYNQALKLTHISNLYYTEPCALLAEKLCTKAPEMKKVFFSNSGAEANEGMIKTARKYSFDKYKEGRSTIITLKNSFHGRTITTLKATGQDTFHNFFHPFTEGFKYVEAENLEELQNNLTPDVCGIMLELIQGEGGVNVLTKEYIKEINKLCKEKDILLLIDEVQTGIGRTGTFFAYQQYDITPDILTFAKGIAGGLPLGGFMVSTKCENTMPAGSHGSTFGGNPVSSAAANVVLDTLTDDFLKEIKNKGNYLKEELQQLNSPNIKEIRGKGLMLGIELQNKENKEVLKEAQQKGLLILTAESNVIRLLPPLTITKQELNKGIKILKELI